ARPQAHPHSLQSKIPISRLGLTEDNLWRLHTYNRRYDATLVRAFAASLSYECLEIQILQWPTRVETKPFTHALGAIASMSPITSTTAVRPEVRAFFKAGP